jgi:hypothetical protein
MKTLFTLLTILFVATFWSQNSIWIRLQNQPQKKNETWTFQNPELDPIFQQFNITGVKKAVECAKSPQLSSIWEIECDCDIASLISEINLNKIGDLAYPAPKYQTLYQPNDLSLIANGNWAVDLIGASGAWDISKSTHDFKIAISDQNIDPNHEELLGKVISYDTLNTQTTTHGTAVAIVAAGNTNNGVGFSSIGFRSSIAFYPMNYNGILQAAYDGLDVVNISWSSGCFYNPYERDIVNEVWSLGTFLVAAAGNGNTCGWAGAPVYPAYYDVVFSVSSIGALDNHEQFLGDTLSTHQHNSKVDLVAPGYGVPISPAQGWYLQSSGTSFAAPFVTGTIALMLSKNPCLTNSEIESILKSTAKDIYSLNPSYVGLIGSGRLDSKRAVEAAAVTLTQEVTISQIWQNQSGQIIIEEEGLQQPIGAIWSGGLTGLENDSLESGFYQISITDAHGCQIDTVIELVETGNPVVVVDTLYDAVDLPEVWSNSESLSLQEVLEQDFLISPNPSSGQITISSNNSSEFSVISSSGELVFFDMIFGQMSINLPTGVYFIQSKSVTKKLIVI